MAMDVGIDAGTAMPAAAAEVVEFCLLSDGRVNFPRLWAEAFESADEAALICQALVQLLAFQSTLLDQSI